MFGMSLTARIARNTFVHVIGKAISVLFGVASVSLLTRYLGQEGFGSYTTVVSFVQFFGTLADLGLYIVSIKRISEAHVDLDRVMSNVVTLRIVSALVFVFAAPLAVLFFPYPPLVKIGVALVSTMNLFLALNQVLIGLYQRSLEVARAAFAEVLGKVALLALVVVAVLQRQSLMVIFLSLVVATAVQCLFSFVWARKFARIRLLIDWPFWEGLLRESWPVALSVALNLIYFRADTIILSVFHPPATVGLYGASYKVLEVLVAFPALLAGLIMPIITLRRIEGDERGFQSSLQKGLDALTTLAFPIVAGVFLLAHPIMTLVAGEEFVASGSILRVLIFAVGSIFLGTMFSNTVVALSRQRQMMKFYLGVAIFSILGYLLFIPRYSVWGAAGMTVATEMAIMVSSIVVVLRATRLRLSFAQAGRALVASLFMIAALLVVRQLPLFASITLGAVVYGAVLAALGGVRTQLLADALRRS